MRQNALEHNGDPLNIPPDQLRRRPGRTEQDDPRHPVADQKIEQLADVGVLHPPVADHDVVAPRLHVPLQVQHHLRKKRIVQAGQDAADDIGAARAEASGQKIGVIALLSAQRQDLFAGLPVNAGRAIQGAGHRGMGDAGQPGDILDGDSAHRNLPAFV